jgi:preprotein translocase subunit SecG
MLASILVFVHFLTAILLIGVILLQRNEGGLGGLGGVGASNFMSAQSAGDALSRATAILATVFIVTSLLLALQNSESRQADTAIERLQSQTTGEIPMPAPLPEVPVPGAPVPAIPTPAPQ